MKHFFLFSFLFFLTLNINSQSWTPLGSNEQTSEAISLTAALTFFVQVSDDGVPYVTYIDDVGGANNLGDFKTHAKRFINGQWEFAGNGISPQFPGSDDFPVALDGNVPYVAYSEGLNPVATQSRLSVRRLNNNTGEWDLVGQQALSDGPATGTVIAASGGQIYVAYSDGAANGKITVKHFDSGDPANGWQTVGISAFSNGFVVGTNLVLDNGIPYVSYLDFGDNLAHIKKFNGTAWEDVGTNNPTGGQQVLIRSLKFNSQHIPYFIFIDAAGFGFLRNLNSANEWETTGGLPFSIATENTASLALLHDVPFVAFAMRNNANIAQMNVKKFSVTNSWLDIGVQPVTASPSSINNSALIAVPGDKLLLVFRNLNLGIYAKTFDASGVLPVRITTFTLTQQNNNNLLKWHTENEVDNRLFEIEHSTDGVIFTKIGEVAAQLPADMPHNYEFTDSHPANGTNYYRLKQIDIDGHFTWSKIISGNFSAENRSVLSLFPNPVKDVLHAESSIVGKKEIVIRNSEGKIMKHVVGSARTLDINVADLPSGTYFLSLYSDRLIDTRSFIK